MGGGGGWGVQKQRLSGVEGCEGLNLDFAGWVIDIWCALDGALDSLSKVVEDPPGVFRVHFHMITNMNS
jgi:hypothetical protein